MLAVAANIGNAATTDADDDARACTTSTPLERLRARLPATLAASAADMARLGAALAPSAATRKRRRLEPPASVLDRVCVPWTGPAYARYAGRTWSPPTLLYTLCVADVDARRTRVVRTCAEPTCVEPTHLQLEAREARLEPTSRRAAALAAAESARAAAERAALADERADEIHARTLATLRALAAAGERALAAAGSP
jgi:hypothetical protein